MPVTFDNAVGKHDDSNVGLGLYTSDNMILTVGDATACIVFFGSNFTGAPSVSAVYAQGVPFTRLATDSDLSMFVLTATPGTGNITISAEFSAAFSHFDMCALSYSGVKASGGFGTPASNSGTGVNHMSLSVSSTTTDLVVACFWQNFRGDSISCVKAGSVQRGLVFGSLSWGQMLVMEIAGAATVHISASQVLTVSNWRGLAISMAFSVAATSVASFHSMLGVGR